MCVCVKTWNVLTNTKGRLAPMPRNFWIEICAPPRWFGRGRERIGSFLERPTFLSNSKTTRRKNSKSNYGSSSWFCAHGVFVCSVSWSTFSPAAFWFFSDCILGSYAMRHLKCMLMWSQPCVFVSAFANLPPPYTHLSNVSLRCKLFLRVRASISEPFSAPFTTRVTVWSLSKRFFASITMTPGVSFAASSTLLSSAVCPLISLHPSASKAPMVGFCTRRRPADTVDTTQSIGVTAASLPSRSAAAPIPVRIPSVESDPFGLLAHAASLQAMSSKFCPFGNECIRQHWDGQSSPLRVYTRVLVWDHPLVGKLHWHHLFPLWIFCQLQNCGRKVSSRPWRSGSRSRSFSIQGILVCKNYSSCFRFLPSLIFVIELPR